MKKVRTAKLSILLLICLLAWGCTNSDNKQNESGTNAQSEMNENTGPADVQEQDESETDESSEPENDTPDYEEQDI